MEVSYAAGFVSHPKGKHTIWGQEPLQTDAPLKGNVTTATL